MAAPPMQPPQLSSEEARVMRECNQESFYRRCVPMSAVMMASTLYMVRSGRWRPSATLGPAPKMAMAGIAGYLIGKLSYIDTCKERLMALPDSKIGQMLRMREQHRRDGSSPQPGFSGLTPPPEQQQQEQQSQQQWTPPPRAEAGLDDYYRPTVDSPETPLTLRTDDLPTAQQNTSYEELRRQNRAEAEARLRHGVSGESTQYPRPPPSPPSPAEEAPPRPAGNTNKYGDAWDA